MENTTAAGKLLLRPIPDAARYLAQMDRADADADFYNQVSRNGEDLYAVCTEHETAGIASICSDGFFYIYIFPEYRNRGCGYLAACAAEAQLRAQGVQSFTTAYSSHNDVAIKLAKKCGFAKKFSSCVMQYPGEAFDLPELPIRNHRDEDFYEAFTMSSEAFHIMRLETGHDPNSVPYPADEETRQLCLATAHERYIYTVDGEIVGCAHIDGAEIDNVSVKISRQGKGYGRNMVKFLVNVILEKNIGAPFLYCLVANRKAWQLYRSLGFQEISRNDYAVK